jgi:exodeoxyribonuclease VII small subunit
LNKKINDLFFGFLPKKMENKSFEELMKELEETVKNLENRDITLDDAVKAYSRGLELSKECYKILEDNQKLVAQKMTKEGLVDFNEDNK